MLTQLQDMDLQLLRIFVTIAESGGFSAAQGKLGVAQSTISTQMSKLETRLGFRLCDRGKSGFRLSPKGEKVYQSAKKLLDAVGTFTRETQGVAEVLLGEIHVGISEFLPAHVLETVASAIGDFRKQAAEVTFEILVATPDELERKLLNNEIQIAIGYFSQAQSSLNYDHAFTERQTLFCGCKNPLFYQESVSMDDIHNASKVTHMYRVNSLGARLYSHSRTALSEQVEADLIFILSGAHIGFLPSHIAKPWVLENKLKPLMAGELSYDATFQISTARNRDEGEALRVFKDKLKLSFSKLINGF